jgi:bifunctional DNase/RNase
MKKRKFAMILMHIEGVRRNFTTSSPFFYSVFLLDEDQKRLLVFSIERHEALPIVATLHNLNMPRPQTITIAADSFKFLGYTLQEVHIEHFSFLPPLYHLCTCRLFWHNGESIQVQHTTMRPGDAIGLSLLMNAPLLVSEELYRELGVPLSSGQTPETLCAYQLLKREGVALPVRQSLRLGYSKTPLRDVLIKEFKAALSGKEPLYPEEDAEQRKQEYLDFLLGR